VSTPTDWAGRVPDPTLNGVGPGNSVDSYFTVYHKVFQSLDQIELKEQNIGGINMYGLVVSMVAPEPSALALLGAAAGTGLLRRRR
jgi:hypothetical protein